MFSLRQWCVRIKEATGRFLLFRYITLKNISPLGYQKAQEFYSPKYKTRQEKENPAADLRSTIYRNPNLRTPKDDKAEVDFYTADAASNYSVIIEGVTSNEEVVYIKEKIQRKD